MYTMMFIIIEEIFSCVSNVCCLILIVLADPGNIGGSMSHEYHVIAPVGEDELIHCEKYTINLYNVSIVLYINNTQMWVWLQFRGSLIQIIF